MLYLHVGTQKTGSSSIQHFLRPNRARLLERGVDFISAARPWIDHNKLAWELRGGGEETPLLDAVVAELQASRAPKQIVSAEMLFHPRVANRLARRMPQALREATRVVIYLRRPDELMEALYKQRVKTGAIEPKPMAYLNANRFECDYLKTLGAFERAFGRDSLEVRPYRRDLLAEGDIVADFLGVIGLQDREGLVRDKPEDNPTFSAAVSEFMGEAVRGAGLASTHLNEVIARDAMPGIRRAGDVFTTEQRRALMAALRPDLERVAADYGPRLAQVFATPDLAEDAPAGGPGTYPRPAERVTLYREAGAAVIAAIGKVIQQPKAK